MEETVKQILDLVSFQTEDGRERCGHDTYFNEEDLIRKGVAIMRSFMTNVESELPDDFDMTSDYLSV